MKKLFLIATLIAFAAMASAQQTFVPCTGQASDYRVFLTRKLTDGIPDCCHYLCCPAFYNEYGLSMHDSTLVYIHADEKTNVFYSGKHKKKRGKDRFRRYEMGLSFAEIRVIYKLFKEAIITANFFVERYGIDGVTYFLSDGFHEVKVWSPSPGSLTSSTVSVMDSLCYATEHADREVLHRQLEQCSKLAYRFRQQYPMSYFEPSKSCSTSMERNSYSACLKVGHSLRVALKGGLENRDSVDACLASIEDSLVLWGRDLFLEHEAHVSVLLCDTSVARCVVLPDETILVIPKDKICRGLIFGVTTLVVGYYVLNDDGEWVSTRRDDFSWWPSIMDILF